MLSQGASLAKTNHGFTTVGYFIIGTIICYYKGACVNYFFHVTGSLSLMVHHVANSRETNKQPQFQKRAQYYLLSLIYVPVAQW